MVELVSLLLEGSVSIAGSVNVAEVMADGVVASVPVLVVDSSADSSGKTLRGRLAVLWQLKRLDNATAADLGEKMAALLLLEEVEVVILLLEALLSVLLVADALVACAFLSQVVLEGYTASFVSAPPEAVL